MEYAQQIKDLLTPEEVLNKYLGQAKRGKYKCPFHSDTNPSLTVNGYMFTCWSCNATGDIIQFVQDYFRIDFSKAIRKLNSDFGLGLSLKKPTIEERYENLKRQEEKKMERLKKESDAAYYRRMTKLYRIQLKRSLGSEIEGLEGYIERLEQWLDDNIDGVKENFNG